MSHVYSFSLISCLCFQSYSFFHSRNIYRLFIIASVLGLVVLIRPVNVLIILFLPFFAGSRAVIKSSFQLTKRNYFKCLGAFITFLSIISFQLIIYKFETGRFLIDTYPNEHFNLLQPHFIRFLFSYKKGLFLYSPILLFTILGLFYLCKKNIYQFYIASFFLFITFYILSSWWNWWYGWSYGCRPFTDFLAIFAILLAIGIESIKKYIIKILLCVVFIVLIFVNQIQTYQYRHLIIHGEKMDREHYWRCFLRIDQLINNKNTNQDLLNDIPQLAK
jgi:hypothetical protein